MGQFKHARVAVVIVALAAAPLAAGCGGGSEKAGAHLVRESVKYTPPVVVGPGATCAVAKCFK
jgi:hypothetical protein